MEVFKPPKNVVFDHNANKNLEDFLQSFDIYLKATGLSAKDNDTKIAIFLNLAGEEAQRKYKTFKLTNEQKGNFEFVIDAFKNYCKPLKNETYDRYKFFTRVQQEGEDFEDFLTDVKMLAAQCNFGDLEDSLIRDKIVSGILDLGAQERLLQRADLTLKSAESFCRAAEVSKYQVKELRNEKEVDVVTVKRGVLRKKYDNNDSPYDCLKCGRRHTKQNCPAFGKSCSICNKPNHFAVGCKNKNYNKHTENKKFGAYNPINKKSNEVHEVENEISDSEVFIDSITVDNIKDKQ